MDICIICRTKNSLTEEHIIPEFLGGGLVLALRRKGKSVYVAGESIENSIGLVQSCQSFLPLNFNFLRIDIALYNLFVPGGTFDLLLGKLNKIPGVKARMNGLVIKIDNKEAPSSSVQSAVTRNTENLPSAIKEKFHFSFGNENDVALVLANVLLKTGYERHIDKVSESASWKKWE